MNCKLSSRALSLSHMFLFIWNIFIEFLFFNCIFYILYSLCAAFKLIHDRISYYFSLFLFFNFKLTKDERMRENKAASKHTQRWVISPIIEALFLISNDAKWSRERGLKDVCLCINFKYCFNDSIKNRFRKI